MASLGPGLAGAVLLLSRVGGWDVDQTLNVATKILWALPLVPAAVHLRVREEPPSRRAGLSAAAGVLALLLFGVGLVVAGPLLAGLETIPFQSRLRSHLTATKVVPPVALLLAVALAGGALFRPRSVPSSGGEQPRRAR